MSKKYEQLIQSIINEDEDRARALFHDIVVEKSRQIYESMMEDEDQVDDLMSDVASEHEGSEFDDESSNDLEGVEFDPETDFDDSEQSAVTADFEDADVAGDEELEDRVVDLEDQLDELMAEFEAMMASEDSDEELDGDFGGDSDLGGDDFGSDEDEQLAEALEMKKVNVTRNADVNTTKSPVAANSGSRGATAKPVPASNAGAEKGRVAPAPKKIEFGQGKVPKPVTTEPKTTNDRSVLGESKVSRKRQIRK